MPINLFGQEVEHNYAIGPQYTVILAQSAYANNQQPEKDSLTHTIYFTGDFGDKKVQPEYPVLKSMFEMMMQDQEKSSVLFLGDFLPKSVIGKDAMLLESALAGKMPHRMLQMLKNYDGNIFIIPGSREWQLRSIKGPEALALKEKFLENQLGKGNVFLPDDACPGPVEIHINDETVLLIIDTQWWLNKGIEKWKDVEEGCLIEDGDFITDLKDAILRNSRKKIIVAGHHPIFSYGRHGGYLPSYTHLTPPLLGSLYILYRKYSGNLNDIVSLRYQQLAQSLTEIFKLHDNLIYISGHERNLQYIPVNKQHYIISGSSISSSYVSKRNLHGFSAATTGYSRLLFHDNNDVYLEFWAADCQSGERKRILNRKLFSKTPELDESIFSDNLSFTGKTIDTLASTAYGKAKPKPGLLGNNYRTEWQTRIQDIPYIDLKTEKGGLQIVKRGGGMQTQSLRLQADDKKQYVLRSIEKFPEAAVPEMLRGTKVEFLVKDLISASHPYAAFAIPPMARAVSVYHTNPKLVYLPDDPKLGIYRKDFANALYLFEERPSKNWKDADHFGNSKEIISTRDVIRKITGDNEYCVDQIQVLRSRLFDLVIGDWDRHDDQWRWATKKNEHGDYYFQPIPRDRDQAFFKSDGILLKFGTKQPPVAKFQGFDYKIKDIKGFSYNARHFDRTFLTEPSWEDWITTISDFKSNLTDEVIAAGIGNLPEPVYKISGQVIMDKLKQRKIDLDIYAKEYYTFLSKNVNVVGSDEKEMFLVNRIDDENTKVTVYDLKQKTDKVDQLIYQRIFKRSETDEIRLYGLGDNDHFQIIGDVKKGIKLRVIGGNGSDFITDRSSVKGLSRKTLIYDTKEGNSLILGRESKNLTSKDIEVNSYSRKAFKYNYIAPYVYFDISPDDGLFLGGKIDIFKHGFRKYPYASKQTVKLKYSPSRNSIKTYYSGDFIHVIYKWNLFAEVDFRYPSYTDYYYGLGNETVFDETLRKTGYYHFKYMMLDIKPVLRREFGQGKHVIGLGAFFNVFELDEDNGTERKFIEDFPEIVLEEDHYYLGPLVHYSYDIRNNEEFTKHGIYFNSLGQYTMGIDEDSTHFLKLKSNLSVYFSTGGGMNTTFAFRVGGETNLGPYQFYQSSDLGGSTNLRGHRRMRFSGNHNAFLNADIRTRLFNLKMPLSPGSLGVLGFFDTGRVWYKNDDGIDPTAPNGISKKWHIGYGGGLWVAPLRQYVFTFTLENSLTDNQLLFKLGYGFFF